MAAAGRLGRALRDAGANDRRRALAAEASFSASRRALGIRGGKAATGLPETDADRGPTMCRVAGHRPCSFRPMRPGSGGRISEHGRPITSALLYSSPAHELAVAVGIVGDERSFELAAVGPRERRRHEESDAHYWAHDRRFRSSTPRDRTPNLAAEDADSPGPFYGTHPAAYGLACSILMSSKRSVLPLSSSTATKPPSNAPCGGQ